MSGRAATTLAAKHSPLDNLVRQHSKRAHTPQYARPPPQVVISPEDEYPSRTHSESPARDSPASHHSQPLSPLLHTRFGRYSGMSERSSTLDGDSTYADDLDDPHRPFSHLTTSPSRSPDRAHSPDSPVLPPSPVLDLPPPGSFTRPPPLQPAPPPRRSDVDPFAFRDYESRQAGAVPRVVVHGAQSDDGHSIHSSSSQRESKYRVPVQIPVEDAPRYNFSRPLRRQDPTAPPPGPAPSPSRPSASPNPQHNPYMRQSPQPSYSPHRSPSPDRDSILAYDSPDPATARENMFALAGAGSGAARHPYAYVSGAPSNYEYDDAASPVEISPLTPHPAHPLPDHTFSSPDKNVTTPWARAERRKTLPPQGGFELRLDEDDDAASPYSAESEQAMGFYAAAFDDASPTRSSTVSASVYDDSTVHTHASARSSAFSAALPAPGRSYDDDERDSPRARVDDEQYFEPRSEPQQFAAQLAGRAGSQSSRPFSPQGAMRGGDTRPFSPPHPQQMQPQDARAFSPEQQRAFSPQAQQPFPRGASPQQFPRGASPQPTRGSSPQHTRGPSPIYPPPSTYPNASPQQHQGSPQQQQRIPPPPPEPPQDDYERSRRADRGVSYYSTTSQYFPPPTARAPDHVQIPSLPPEARPPSSTSVYSNYSYYAIPPSPTGSGGATPTDERFGARLAPTASGRGAQAPGPSYGAGPGPGPSYGAGPSNYGGAPSPRGSPSKAQAHGREQSEGGTLRAARDIVVSGRASEDTIREKDRGWFGRRERRPSHEGSSTGRRSPTGSSYSHKHYVPTLPNPSPDTLRADSAPEFLTLGIAAHEALQLPQSAYCFEQAATLRGGCAVGMLMWGLALRHGWGVRKDEKEAFKWLRRAAGRAVEGLEAAGQGGEKGELEGVKTELVLAIYEVGQCFFHGWGVVMDKKMAVSYYQVAARLGDADAQQALAFCYANGRGTKKDLKESAKWYRAAAAQGASTVGLAWIYKTKYGAEADADGRPAQR